LRNSPKPGIKIGWNYCDDARKRRHRRRLKIAHTHQRQNTPQNNDMDSDRRRSNGKTGGERDPERDGEEERIIFLPRRRRSQRFNILPVLLSSTVKRWRSRAAYVDLVRAGVARWRSSQELPTRLWACAHTPPPDNGLDRFEGESS